MGRGREPCLHRAVSQQVPERPRRDLHRHLQRSPRQQSRARPGPHQVHRRQNQTPRPRKCPSRQRGVTLRARTNHPSPQKKTPRSESISLRGLADSRGTFLERKSIHRSDEVNSWDSQTGQSQIVRNENCHTCRSRTTELNRICRLNGRVDSKLSELVRGGSIE